MAERLICPACSGPLEIEEGQDVVECGFCGASFDVIRDGGETSLEVREKPHPQQEVMTHQAEDVMRTVLEEPGDTPSLPEEGTSFEPDTGIRSGGEPVAPGITSLETNKASIEDFGLPEPERVSAARIYESVDDAAEPATGPINVAEAGPGPTFPTTPFESQSPMTSTIPQSPPTPGLAGDEISDLAPPRRNNAWLPIAIGVFVVVCMLCACMAGAFLIAQRQGGMF